ncbi:MAG: MobQ family relaxase [Methylomicrobium sp.]
MAIYHCDVSVVSRNSGRSVIAAAAYRAGEKLHDETAGITHDYTHKQGVLHCEIMAPHAAPGRVNDRAQLWNAVEASEKRKDAQLAREIMVALPKELNLAQCLALVRGYIREQFTSKGMIADFALHAPSKKGDQRNHHVHILLTLRHIMPTGFGFKVREWNAKVNIYQWRKAWECHANRALQQAGLDCRIDSHSHASKGLNKEPRLHLGPQATALERKGIPTERGNENRAIEARNERRAKLRHELDEIKDEIDKLQQEITQARDSSRTLAQQDELTVANGEAKKSLQVIDPRTGVTDCLTSYVKKLIIPLADISSPRQQYTTEELLTDQKARLDYFAQKLAEREREAAIGRLSNAINHGEDLSGDDIDKLHRADLEAISVHGDDYLRHFLHEMERDDEWER